MVSNFAQPYTLSECSCLRSQIVENLQMTCLETEIQDGVAVVTLNRPERRNALSGELVQSLIEQLSALQDDKEVRAVVLTGQGKGFCAGGDLAVVGRVVDCARQPGKCRRAEMSDAGLESDSRRRRRKGYPCARQRRRQGRAGGHASRLPRRLSMSQCTKNNDKN